jgi:predicted membrane protein
LFLTSLIVWQVFYRYVLGSDFPKNAYLSGIFAPLGVIVITIALRIQIDSQTNGITVYRAFW